MLAAMLLKLALGGGARVARGAGLGLPLLGAGLIALSAFLAHAHHSIRAAGAARVELRRMAEIAAGNHAAMRRYKAGMEATRMASQEAERRAQTAREKARQAREGILALPGNGSDAVCPIDCKLP